jgi:signal transduction histidine kinase
MGRLWFVGVLFLLANHCWATLKPVVFEPVGSLASTVVQRATLPVAEGETWLVVPPLDRPASLFWAGALLFEAGDASGHGRHKTMSSAAVLLPPGADRTLELRWYGPPPVSRGFQWGPRSEVQTWVFVRNSLGPGLVGALVVTALVFALSIGLLLLFTRGRLKAIPGVALVLVNLSFVATWLNLVISLPFVPETPLAIATHWGFVAWGLSGLYLALEFTELLPRSWLRALPWLLALEVPGLVWLLLASEPAEVVRRYNLAVLPFNLLVDLLTVAVAVAAVVRKPSPRTWGFAALAIPSIVAAFHDIWWFVVFGERPYMAFLPVVGLALNLYFVIVFFYDTSRLYLHLQDEVRSRTHALERFVGLLSHDLRNVLHGIHGMAQVLDSPQLRPTHPDKLAQLYTALQAATRESQAVLGSLLNLSHLRTGVLVPHPQTVVTSDLWAAALKPWAENALVRHLTVDLRDPGPGVFLADFEMTVTILRNLVDNAIRHSPEGSKVTLTTETAGTALVLAVTDRGGQLTQAALDELFDSSTKRLRVGDQTGSGFGLVLCQDLAQRQGFKLTATLAIPGVRFALHVPGGLVLTAEEGKPTLSPGLGAPRLGS